MKNKIFSIFASVRRIKRPALLRDRQLMHPEREWVIGLVIAVACFIGVASVSAYTYFSNQAVDVDVASDQTTDTVYRESLVEEVLQSIKKREERLHSLNREDPPPRVEEVIVSNVSASSTEVQSEPASLTTE